MDPGPEKVSYSEIKKSGAGKKVVQRIKSVQRKMELKRERERGRKGGGRRRRERFELTDQPSSISGLYRLG